MRRHIILAASIALLLPCVAVHAEDSFYFDQFRYPATITGLRDGKLAATVAGADKFYDLDKVQVISLSAYPKFNDAEIARASDAQKAAALYKEAIRSINTPALKQLAEFRAIAPADADGKWTDAVNYFLDLYQASPIDAIWKARPSHLPPQSSSMLKESAEHIAAVIRTVKSEDARKNLKMFQLEIVTRAGDTETAQALAREIATGIPEEQAKPREPDPAVQANSSLSEIETAIQNKNYDAAISKADTLLDFSPPDVCVQLFKLKARAYEEQNKLDLAAATLLRISAHYPGEKAAIPVALLQAADLEKRAGHPDAAKALLDDILTRFPNSPEAIKAKSQ